MDLLDEKIRRSIKRLQEFEPEEGYLIAFSGGKDSQVIYHLAKMAGVKFRAEVAPTPDPPELIYFRRKHYTDVIERKCKPFTKRQAEGKYEGRPRTIFNLISSRKIPPTRVNRYCCSELKENVGEKGDTVVVGVRWSESRRRKGLSMVNFWKGKTMLRPIIDWTEEDVWNFLKRNNIPYCELYDKGFKRLGCVGCPLSHNQKKELELYPKYKENYIRAFDRMLKNLDHATTWKTGEDVMKWWLGEKVETEEEECSMFED